jgi:uncharacterized protein (DUF305 family)
MQGPRHPLVRTGSARPRSARPAPSAARPPRAPAAPALTAHARVPTVALALAMALTLAVALTLAPAPVAAQDHGAHHGHGDHGHVMLPATAGPGYTVADVHFMQMMIGHHDQAVRMVALVEGRDAGPEVTTLALRIRISQEDEIVFMERWLEERGQVVPDEEQRRAMEMPGMVTEDQFAEMAGARGQDFDRLFLRYMIAHHLGALEMVDELFRSPGAVQDTELFPFVTDVGADQLDEIGIMERILAEMGGEGGPTAGTHHPHATHPLASPQFPNP